MITSSRRGNAFVLKRNKAEIAVLLKRESPKDGVQFYDWTTKMVYEGSTIEEVCERLESAIGVTEQAQPTTLTGPTKIAAGVIHPRRAD